MTEQSAGVTVLMLKAQRASYGVVVGHKTGER